MYAVSIHPSRSRALLSSVLAVGLAIGVQVQAQAQSQAQQQQAASAAANGTDRSIIFVGGRRQEDNTGSATHARAHPPSPCTSAHEKHLSPSDDCSLNPQPIPPGRSMHTPTNNTHAQPASQPVESDPEGAVVEDVSGG